MHNQWDLSQEQLVREKALYQYLSAFERGDFELMGTVLQKAIQDPLLEAMILEAHEYYQAEEQITLRGDEREKILQMVLEHLPSDIGKEQDEMAIPPLTVADVIANVQQDRALTGSVKQETQMISEQIPSPQKSPPYPARLTARELEVLRLVARGLTNEQVAAYLCISPRTVETHLPLIYSKIGVSSRSAAIRYAMQHDLGGEQGAALQSAVDENLTPVSELQEAALRSLGLSELVGQCVQQMSAYRRGEPSTDVYGVELLRRATIGRNPEAWAALQQCLAEVVRSWLRGHPSWEIAVHLDSEEHYVAQAFERFWWATTQSQQIQFRTVAAALQYLRASLHGALLDTMRAYVRPKEIHLPEPSESGEPWAEDGSEGQEFLEVIRRLLPNQREQRLAYLLFHCGLKPREIVRFCPQEFSSMEDIYRLRRTIVERLVRHADSIRWQLNS